VSSENRAVLDRINEEAFRQGNVGVIDELVAEDFVEHDPPPGTAPGREGFKDMIRTLHRAFDDQGFTIHDQIAEGDRVVERWTMTATHVGDWLGIPATGKRIVVAGMDISRLEDGRLAEHWTQMDALGMLQQLGVIPAEETTAS
jgi:steroid delta-isomerase-like uncharacterized protein